MGAFAEAVAGQWIPYRLNAAGRDAFGASLSESDKDALIYWLQYQ